MLLNSALSHSANEMRVILALGQLGVSSFALVRKKIKKTTLYVSTNKQLVILPSML